MATTQRHSPPSVVTCGRPLAGDWGSPRLPERLLAHFRSHSGRVLSRDELATQVWGLSLLHASRTIDVTISALRRRLPPGERIVTVFRSGYRHDFTAPC